jgi:hypothetical protein
MSKTMSAGECVDEWVTWNLPVNDVVTKNIELFGGL